MPRRRSSPTPPRSSPRRTLTPSASRPNGRTTRQRARARPPSHKPQTALDKRPARVSPAAFFSAPLRSAAIELHHEVGFHMHGEGHIGEAGDAGELGSHLVVVGLDIIGHITLGAFDGLEQQRHLLGLFLHLDEIADAASKARNIDAPAVHRDMAVTDELAGSEHGRHELGPVDDGIEPPLQQSNQVFGGGALEPARGLIDAVELALGNVGVVALQLLLCPELLPIVGELAAAAFTVLARLALALVEGAFWPSPDVLAQAPIDLVLRLDTLGHASGLQSRVGIVSSNNTHSLLYPAATGSTGTPPIAGCHGCANGKGGPQRARRRCSLI